MKRIWMVAAENGAFKGGKIGGIADVVRDLPQALADLGHEVSVLMPAYGVFNRLPQARHDADIKVRFGGNEYRTGFFRVGATGSAVRYFVVEHPLITRDEPGTIYHHDLADGPFATDGGRFAFFCAAVAEYAEQCDTPPDVLHLHDWQTGLIPALRRFDPKLKRLRKIHVVYTIHNLAYQGIRPFAGHHSSFESWFPRLDYTREQLADPRYPDCVNPMAVAIRMTDKLNTVSPTYAQEILRPNDPSRGFNGGEGLEEDLRLREAAGCLSGILNGCFYPGPGGRRPGWNRLLHAIAKENHLFDNDPVARANLDNLPSRRPAKVLVSIGRVGPQKVSLLLEPVPGFPSALEAMLEQHGRSMAFIMLGSGDPAFEQRLVDIAARHPNLLFLRGYAESLPDLLYPGGDLFIMPSSFEPCGISQMLAMRSSQPCVVHAVGGLRDTVSDDVNGFTFAGDTAAEQAANFVACVNRALTIKLQHRERWNTIRKEAAKMRFSWEASARSYLSELYEP